MIKKISTITAILLLHLVTYGQAANTDVYKLSIDNVADVTVQQGKDFIKTKNIFTKTKSEFQVDFYFDGAQLFYIQLIKPDAGIDKTYGVERTFINGYGYLQKETDYKINFKQTQQKTGTELASIQRFAENPDFTDNEQLTIYFEELYGNIVQFVAENMGTVAFFGDVVADKKNDFLYFRFDDEAFSADKKIKIERNSIDNYSKKYEGSYRIDFDRKQLKNHSTIDFSASLKHSKDTMLLYQNRINLVALRKTMLTSPIDTATTIYTDIYLDQSFEQLITPKTATSQEDKKYIGTYQVKNRNGKDICFELREGNTYYSKKGNTEEIGLWKIGKVNFMNEVGINIYKIHTINKKVGNKRKPADIGDAFDLIVDGEKLLYPISPPEGWKEIEKLK